MNWQVDMNPLMESVLRSGTESRWSDWHAHVSIQFGELLESGFDWGADEYDTSFTGPHRARLNKKIEDRYYYREICATPPGKFRHFMIRKLNEVIPKYKKLYDLEDASDIKVLRQETWNAKSRDMFSEYPQTQLQGDNDYATNANDHADGHIKDGPPIDMVIDYKNRYDDIDVMVLDELEVCFSSLMTTSLNAGV